MINKNLAYILGVFVGDGYANKNSIGLNTKDKDFAIEFQRALEKEFKKEGKLHFKFLSRIFLNCLPIVFDF